MECIYNKKKKITFKGTNRYVKCLITNVATGRLHKNT